MISYLLNPRRERDSVIKKEKEGSMMKKIQILVARVSIVLILVILCFMALFTRPVAAQSKVFEWVYQCPWPALDTSWDPVSLALIESIEKVTQGQVKIKAYNSAAFVSFSEQHNAISKGVIQAGISTGSILLGTLPVASIASNLPLGWNSEEDYQDILHNYGLLELERNNYAKLNLYLLGEVYSGAYVLAGNFPMEKLSDFKGKKMRLLGLVLGNLMKKVGVSPVTMPGTDVYMALKLGTIDGCSYTLPEFETMKFKEVVKYMLWPPVSTSVHYDVVVNLNSWKELGPDLQKKVQQAFDVIQPTVVTRFRKMEADAFQKVKDYGVQVVKFSDTDIQDFRNKATEVWQELGEKDPETKKAVDMIINYNKSHKK